MYLSYLFCIDIEHHNLNAKNKKDFEGLTDSCLTSTSLNGDIEYGCLHPCSTENIISMLTDKFWKNCCEENYPYPIFPHPWKTRHTSFYIYSDGNFHKIIFYYGNDEVKQLTLCDFYHEDIESIKHDIEETCHYIINSVLWNILSNIIQNSKKTQQMKFIKKMIKKFMRLG